jgi:hypothetical protein
MWQLACPALAGPCGVSHRPVYSPVPYYTNCFTLVSVQLRLKTPIYVKQSVGISTLRCSLQNRMKRTSRMLHSTGESTDSSKTSSRCCKVNRPRTSALLRYRAGLSCKRIGVRKRRNVIEKGCCVRSELQLPLFHTHRTHWTSCRTAFRP